MLSTVLLILVLFIVFLKIADLKIFQNVVNRSFNPGVFVVILKLQISMFSKMLSIVLLILVFFVVILKLQISKFSKMLSTFF